MRRLPFGCVLFCLTVFTGCSGKSPNNPTTPTNPTTPAQTVQQVLQAGQASGALPTLDTGASVAGTDADGNGVRDDIDKFVAGLPDSAPQKKALLQLAASVQSSLLVDTTNAGAVTAVAAKLNNAVACTFQVYTGSSAAQNRAFTMEEISVNTMPRIVAYQAYNNARNFSTTVLPTGTVCQ